MVRFAVELEDNGKIRCDACPVLCYIKDGRSGACDRYANEGGELVRVDPFTILERKDNPSQGAVPFLRQETDDSKAQGKDDDLSSDDVATSPENWNGDILKPERFVTAMTVVTEGIFSYCGVKIKIDTDRHIGPEQSLVRVQGEAVGHVTTGEYGSQMMSLGGVNHLTGGSKKEGRLTCQTLLQLCNREAVELCIDNGADITVQAGQAPVVNGVREQLMRVGCGSATIGMFARQWAPHVDEVVVVDDHITGVLSEHQAGKLLDMKPTGIRIKGRKSTPGRYFQVAEPGAGWGGTDIDDPLTIIEEFKPSIAYPGLRLLMVSTTGEQWGYFELNDDLVPTPADLPDATWYRRQPICPMHSRNRLSEWLKTVSLRCVRSCSWVGPEGLYVQV